MMYHKSEQLLRNLEKKMRYRKKDEEMSKKQCEKFKCVYEKNAPDCFHCQFDTVCPYSGTCAGCLFGMASDFIGCPEKPLVNFSRKNQHVEVQSGCMGKIKLGKANFGEL